MDNRFVCEKIVICHVCHRLSAPIKYYLFVFRWQKTGNWSRNFDKIRLPFGHNYIAHYDCCAPAVDRWFLFSCDSKCSLKLTLFNSPNKWWAQHPFIHANAIASGDVFSSHFKPQLYDNTPYRCTRHKNIVQNVTPAVVHHLNPISLNVLSLASKARWNHFLLRFVVTFVGQRKGDIWVLFGWWMHSSRHHIFVVFVCVCGVSQTETDFEWR